ncbi:hypothetical protein DIE28_09985 [Paracoccus thiocyanatus]|uniref:Uncharacterized protein n=1 Tax=Paracoccus thiocyanatus TaxID=34006 RepID=A0A3D8PD23_9RHOB|nr:hypothetical protein DIE28_09985 [Paracoccus thiocyanatus]
MALFPALRRKRQDNLLRGCQESNWRAPPQACWLPRPSMPPNMESGGRLALMAVLIRAASPLRGFSMMQAFLSLPASASATRPCAARKV